MPNGKERTRTIKRRRSWKGYWKSRMRYSAVKGVQDILPPDIYIWQAVEAGAGDVFRSYGFQEFRPPIMEFTDVFSRSIGETSDIVEKEMYTFADRGGRSISLRPEGTAPIVRSYVQNHLHNLPSPQKFYYTGPMFRYERPQKGRLRQFYQIGVEAFGSAEPMMDAEVISMLMAFLEKAGLEGPGLQINSLGCPQCRPAFREAIDGFFSSRLGALCEDCRRRHERNPMRILDCKAAGCVQQRRDAPQAADYLCNACREHFGELRGLLEVLEVPHEVNPALVRGLDYYTGTIFEVASERLGAQNAVAAGGRYDGLVKDFGGPSSPAIGFAVGMERLVSLLKERAAPSPTPDIFIASLGSDARKEALKAARRFRDGGRWVELGSGGDSLKSQMRRADKFRAEYVIIIGEDELESGSAVWKRLKDGATGRIGLDDITQLYSSDEVAG
jgi:histidyl-tRNA synthetase